MAKSRLTLFEQLKEEQSARGRLEQTTTRKVLRWSVILTYAILITLMFPGRTAESYRISFDKTLLGTVWTNETLKASFTFPVTKPPSILETEIQNSRNSTAEVFIIDTARADRSASVIAAVTQFLMDKGDTVVLPAPVMETMRNLPPNIQKTVAQMIKEHSQNLLSSIYEYGFVNKPISTLSNSYITLQVDKVTEKQIPSLFVFDSARVTALAERTFAGLSADLRMFIIRIWMFACRPNLTYSEVLTERARSEAEWGIPKTLEIIRAGDIVVRKQEKLDEQALYRLASYREAELLMSDHSWDALILLGSFGHAILLMIILVSYLYYLRRQSFERLGHLAGLCSLPVIAGGMAWVSVIVPVDWPLEFAVLIPAMAMLVSILFDARTAFAVAVVMALTVAAVRGNDYVVAFVLLVTGLLAAYTVKNIKSRTQVFTSIVAILIGMIVSIVALDLERGISINQILEKIVVGSVNAVLSPLVTFGIVLVFERLFNVATDLRLDEFNTTSHQLLERMNSQAPGTYQHTLTVASLSEAAATAIGANSLLARVGALYHDIGKIEKSEYFVENQIAIDNKHDKLTPKKSASIIRQHVQDGIELAKKYGLPQRIIDFIPMHHGTQLIKHFYAEALDESLLKESVINEDDFRYPGPQPNSRETAIVMIADASEAIARTLSSTKREDYERAVSDVFNERLADGQLKECPLTLHELELIKECIVKNIFGMSHQRIKYREMPDIDSIPEISDDSASQEK